MEKLNLFAEFQEMLKRRFPGRRTPITKEIIRPELKRFNDERFEGWRKKK